MIGSVNNGGWSVQQTDAAKVANDLFNRVEGNAQTGEGNSRHTARLHEQDQTESRFAREGASIEQQVGAQLAAQRDQSRFAREDNAARNATAQSVFGSLDTQNKGYLDRENLQAAFDKMSDDSEANARKVDQIFKALDADNNNQITESEFAIGIDQIDQQSATQATADNANAVRPENAPPPGGVPAQAADDESEPADINRDGTVSLQELVTYQTKQAETQQIEQGAQQERAVAERITNQLVQTYGRFDVDIANATAAVNPFSATA